MGKVQKVDGAKLGAVCYRQNPEELKNATNTVMRHLTTWIRSECTMGTGSFPGVKSGRGVALSPHPLLVPWS
jgi:hypothetical protein